MSDDELTRLPGGDRAGRRYWDGVWASGPAPQPLDLDAPGVEGYVNRRFAELFRALLGAGEGRSLVEVGCGRSVWLPFFAYDLGFSVTGIDYSERGCEEARGLLARARVTGDVVVADVFEPPPSLVGSFDVAVTQGVLEHFDDTSAAVAAVARLVRPGGSVLTLIPNLSATIGLVTRLLNPRVYEKHVPLTCEQLAAAHERAGLQVVAARYFLSTSFGVANLHGVRPHGLAYAARAAALRGLRGFSKAALALESRWRRFPERRLLAPYVVCLAEKPPRPLENARPA